MGCSLSQKSKVIPTLHLSKSFKIFEIAQIEAEKMNFENSKPKCSFQLFLEAND